MKKMRTQLGMTLIEIMIVLAIVGALMALLAPRFTGAQDKAKVREAKIQIGQIMNALSMYYTDCGSYPSSEAGLKALTEAPSEEECPNWGPSAYLKKEPKDPWNREFRYDLDGGDFVLLSYGKDGREGGSGYDKDLSSEEI